MSKFADMRAVKRANARSGRHFFDDDAMAFFDSRIECPLIKGRYFITSEQDHQPAMFSFRTGEIPAYDGPRRYTIRRANDDGSIDTVGEFGQYETCRAAGDVAHKLPPDPAPCAWCGAITYGIPGHVDVCKRCHNRDELSAPYNGAEPIPQSAYYCDHDDCWDLVKLQAGGVMDARGYWYCPKHGRGLDQHYPSR